MAKESRSGCAPHLTALVQGSGAPGRRLALVVGAAAIASSMPLVAFGQVAVTLNGPPVQVVPYVSEPGVPMITISPGTPNPFPADDGGMGSGGSGGGSGDGYVAGSDPLNTMMGTTWGMTAIANAQSVGVNPSALAATCVLESGCQNISGSGAQGVFQMFPAAFHDGLNAALAANPALASQIAPGDTGRMDPTTEAIAATGYQILAVKSLQTSGIANPTVLDTRSYYEFGPAYGAPVANASPSTPLADVVPPSFLTQNNIPQNATVGQWQSSVSVKIGNAAGQAVMM